MTDLDKCKEFKELNDSVIRLETRFDNMAARQLEDRETNQSAFSAIRSELRTISDSMYELKENRAAVRGAMWTTGKLWLAMLGSSSLVAGVVTIIHRIK